MSLARLACWQAFLARLLCLWEWECEAAPAARPLSYLYLYLYLYLECYQPFHVTLPVTLHCRYPWVLSALVF